MPRRNSLISGCLTVGPPSERLTCSPKGDENRPLKRVSCLMVLRCCYRIRADRDHGSGAGTGRCNRGTVGRRRNTNTRRSESGSCHHEAWALGAAIDGQQRRAGSAKNACTNMIVCDENVNGDAQTIERNATRANHFEPKRAPATDGRESSRRPGSTCTAACSTMPMTSPARSSSESRLAKVEAKNMMKSVGILGLMKRMRTAAVGQQFGLLLDVVERHTAEARARRMNGHERLDRIWNLIARSRSSSAPASSPTSQGRRRGCWLPPSAVYWNSLQ